MHLDCYAAKKIPKFTKASEISYFLDFKKPRLKKYNFQLSLLLPGTLNLVPVLFNYAA